MNYGHQSRVHKGKCRATLHLKRKAPLRFASRREEDLTGWMDGIGGRSMRRGFQGIRIDTLLCRMEGIRASQSCLWVCSSVNGYRPIQIFSELHPHPWTKTGRSKEQTEQSGHNETAQGDTAACLYSKLSVTGQLAMSAPRSPVLLLALLALLAVPAITAPLPLSDEVSRLSFDIHHFSTLRDRNKVKYRP